MKTDANPNSRNLSAAEPLPMPPPPSFGLSLSSQAKPDLTGDPSKDIANLALYNLQRLDALAEALETRLPECQGPKELTAMVGHLMNVRSKTVRLATEAVDDISEAIGKKVKKTVEAD
jgi:hypothetical protein